MLLNFSAGNYKSFIEPFSFSLRTAPKQKGLDYSVLTEKIGSKAIKGLCSSVIYGPNASGKTNIIGALDTFKEIVLRGHIRNASAPVSERSNVAAAALELIPNHSLAQAKPVTFSIEFTTRGFLFQYDLEINLGLFMAPTVERKIVAEKLSINGEPIFSRHESVEIMKPSRKIFELFVPYAGDEEYRTGQNLANTSLNSEELFLTNGFKTIFSQRIVQMMMDWLTNHLAVVYHADHLKISISEDKYYEPIREEINPAAVRFGIGANSLEFARKTNDEAAKPVLCSKINGRLIPAEVFESYGTIRFVNMLPLLFAALRTGATLFIDEFDASIHPMALMSIINVFHNDEINVHGAQLVFNTHNPIFLNSDLFRRDEIKFVERREDERTSRLYALSDFGTTGERGVRKGEDYITNYFINKYGAIKDIDFADLFQAAVEGATGKEGA